MMSSVLHAKRLNELDRWARSTTSRRIIIIVGNWFGARMPL